MDNPSSYRKWFHVCSLLTLCSVWSCSEGHGIKDTSSESDTKESSSGSETESEAATGTKTGTKAKSETVRETTGADTAQTQSERPASTSSVATSKVSHSGTLSGPTLTQSSTTTTSNATTGPSTPSCGPRILVSAVIRDFSMRQEGNKPKHPDFQQFTGEEETVGLVQDTLNSQGKPVAALPINTKQLTSAENFAQWYTDVPGVNHTFQRSLEFVEDTKERGIYEYKNNRFFPIGPNDGWGKQQFDHNFGFTTEISLQFQYKKNQTFTFTGDDDLWLFIEGKLALDIGGLHPPVKKTLDLDVVGPRLGLVHGRLYTMKIFHAERRATGSNFHVRSNIGCFFEPG